MIPKVIHYCWFGHAEKPNLIKHCIASWKKVMPDYEIKEWNETNFDINISPLCREAYQAKKWAFVADYCRIYVLLHYGGIYMDTDIITLKRFDPFLTYSFCSCQEYQPWVKVEDKQIDENGYRIPGKNQKVINLAIQSGVMMAEENCPFMQDCLDYYNDLHLEGDIIICRILSLLMEKYGYRYILEKQILENNICVEQPHVFSNMTMLCNDSYAWHLYYRSWGNGFSLKQKIRNNYTRIYLLSQLIYHRKFSWQLIKGILL